MSAVLRGGKRQKGGNVLYLGCLRDIEPKRCPQLGLAMHLLQMFVINKVQFQHACRADVFFALLSFCHLCLANGAEYALVCKKLLFMGY